MITEERIVNLGDINYKIGRLDTFTQFHIARRLAPLLANLGQALKEAAPLLEKGKPAEGAEKEKEEEEVDYDALSVAMGPIADTLAKMSDADVNYILHSCLAVCQREIAPGRYSPVQLRNGTRLMFEDIEMPVMVGLAINTIQDSLSSFFPTGPQTSAATK
jgi:hypothetical protein